MSTDGAAAAPVAETSASQTRVDGPAVAVLLQNNREEVVTDWVRALKSGAYSGYADVPIDELESACAQCLAAFIATLKQGDHARMRRFVRREVRLRLAQGYHESEIDQMLCAVRVGAWPLIAAAYAADGHATAEALGLLQHCVEQACFEMSDFYQTLSLQKADEHLAEMEAMNRRLEEISVRDPLTGLYNRRYFQDRLLHEFQRGERHQRPMALIMLDIDHFKRVNDTYGHPVGDEVLRGLALVLVNQTRTIDIVCRYGGEEFAALLPETDLDAAHQVAERLREVVAHTGFHRLTPGTAGTAGAAQSAASAGGVNDVAGSVEGDQLHCTVSVGVASYDGTQFLTAEQFVEAADKALYAAKHGGRNRVVIAMPS